MVFIAYVFYGSFSNEEEKKKYIQWYRGSIPHKQNTNALYTQLATAFIFCLHFNTQLNFKNLMFFLFYDTHCVEEKDRKRHIGVSSYCLNRTFWHTFSIAFALNFVAFPTYSFR